MYMSLRKRFPTDQSPSEKIAAMIRVNQAGEAGAVRIYEGQLAVLGKTAVGPTIAHMKTQEDDHLDAFNALIRERHIRPTALSPLWNALGYGMGWLTARLSPQAAMACTVAVEDVINTHYAQQENLLANHPEEAPLRDLIARCRQEELEHHDIGLAQGAEKAPAYGLLSATIRCCTKVAIALSKRI